jgi:hypothetical protein
MPSITTTVSRPRRRKLAAGVGSLALVAAAATAPTPAMAVDQVQHFLDCFGWMLNDPAQHAANCSPGHAEIIPSHAYGFQAGAPIVAPGPTSSSGCPSGASGCTIT